MKMKILFVGLTILMTLLVVAQTQAVEGELRLLEEKEQMEGCLLKAYGREGKPTRICANGFERVGFVCYPKCKENYTAVGAVCWENCPSGWKEDGVSFCLKPPSHKRTVEYALWDKEKCESENSNGCERWGLSYYPKCKENFHSVGCCLCSPDCPNGHESDIGKSCAKKPYGRGVGEPLVCKEGEQQHARLCYSSCSEGYKSVGPVCWGRCPEGFTQCGALCLKGKKCADQIKTYFDGVLKAVSDFGDEKNVEGTIDVGKFAKDFIFDVCSM